MSEAGETVAQFMDALTSNDVPALELLLAPDFIFEDAAGSGRPSVEAFLHELALIRAGLPDVQYRVVRVTPEGVRHYVEFRAIGTHDGPFLNVEPTGTLAVVSGVFNLQLEQGRVKRLRATVDFAGLRRQLLLAARTASQNR